MVKYENGKLEAELLDSSGTMNVNTIKSYNYVDCKNNFEEVVDILATNKLIHATVSEILKYDINKDLYFEISDNFLPSEYTCVDTKDIGYIKLLNSDKEIITLNRHIYDVSISMCLLLLRKVKDSFNELNEVERYIIKSLEFDLPHLTDEELVYNLKTYNKNYYNIKRSAFIKLALQLEIYDNKICALKRNNYMQG